MAVMTREANPENLLVGQSNSARPLNVQKKRIDWIGDPGDRLSAVF
jgi:hypothetical protein